MGSVRQLADSLEGCTIAYKAADVASYEEVKAVIDTAVVMKGSAATPSLVAGIMNAKYVNGMPPACQERESARYDLDLSAKTMADGIILCAGRCLQPVYDLMKEEFLRSKYAHLARCSRESMAFW